MDIVTQLQQELNHLTLAQQSEVTGVTICTLSRIWNKQLAPKVETMEKIANACGKTLALTEILPIQK